MKRHHVVVACAGLRGLRCLSAITAAVPEARITVVSFREEAWEPPYLGPIQAFTASIGGGFLESRSIGGRDLSQFWQKSDVDLMLVIGWRYLIPRNIYERPRLGTFVLHDSLLPKYRGFAPTQWAMINGESATGASLFRIAETVDSGPLVDQVEIPITESETIAPVMERVTDAYVELLRRNLPRILREEIALRIQDESAATYTCKRTPDDNRVSWEQSTDGIFNLIRATTHPYPGAFSTLNGVRLVIWSAERLTDERKYVGSVPGRVAEIRPNEGVAVLTGDGALLLREVELGSQGRVCASTVIDRITYTLGR